MKNELIHGRVFSSREEVEKILTPRSGVVVIKDEHGLRAYGKIETIKGGDYERNLRLARAGARVLNPGKKVEIIMI